MQYRKQTELPFNPGPEGFLGGGGDCADLSTGMQLGTKCATEHTKFIFFEGAKVGAHWGPYLPNPRWPLVGM